MENKNQLNQNSDSLNQNEKSEAASNAVESNANQPILNEQEKNYLVELITGKTTAETKISKACFCLETGLFYMEVV